MTREELAKLFDLSGGFFSSAETLSATYVYKGPFLSNLVFCSAIMCPKPP